MNDDDTKSKNNSGKHDIGRTLWDFLTLVLSSKRLWRIVLGGGVVWLILSYFDLVNIQYDGGLKVRVGVDPEKRKQDELIRQQKEDALLLTERHQKVYEGIKGEWIGAYENHSKFTLIAL